MSFVYLARAPHSDKTISAAIVAAKGVELVAAAMEKHASSVKVQGNGCGALASLAHGAFLTHARAPSC
jgi:hypothetical protein